MRIRPVVPTLSSRTSPAGTSGWHPARSAGTGVPHRDPTRGRRLLLQHPRGRIIFPPPPMHGFSFLVSPAPMAQLSQHERAQNHPSSRPRPPAAGGEGKKPSLRAAGGRKRPGSPTGCEKLETAARCPVAAGGSQGHGGDRSGRSPGTAAPGHGATPSNAFAAAREQPGDPPVPPLCAGTRVAALRSGLCWASSSLMSFWGGFPRAARPPKESLSLFGVLIPQILRVLHSQFLRHPLLSP